ncbi:MAG: ELM1/GtrOC1 family putative glycosyltransferase, partial [Candidatus Omnitrophota bacterium]|nr:ELM1/GtrOC1 family putative glycosyltransferase [Candidatus Omnitrophota bacterium]
LNLILSSESRAKSICILKPGILNSKRFDLVIVPKHDKAPLAKNILVTSGSPNLIDAVYLEEKKQALLGKIPHLNSAKAKIGVLLGGNTKKSILDKESLDAFIEALKKNAEALDTEILFTTSRRSSPELEKLAKARLSDFPRCKLLVVANEKNIPEAVGGILALSKILIVSEDSISMVSEAASSGKSVIVWRYKSGSQLNLSDKHDRFLKELSDKNHIILATAAELPQKIEDLFKGKVSTVLLNDREVIKKAVDLVI